MSSSQYSLARREIVWFVLILLLALTLRSVHLGTHTYWQDEVHNLLKAEHIQDVVFRGDIESNHPPLFPILVWLWRLAGLDGNEWTMRALSVTLGMLSIVATSLVARRLFGVRVGLITAFLLAISPFHIHHSQELKEYMVLPITGPLMVLAFYEAIERNTVRWWIAYALAAASACYSELFVGPMLVGINLWFLLFLRGRTDRLKGWLLANVAGALLFTPSLIIMLMKAKTLIIDLTQWWVPRPSLIRLGFYLKTIAFGYSDLKPWFHIATAAFLLLMVAGALVAIARSPRNGILLLLAWFAIPVAIVYTLSFYTQSIFLFRSMMPYSLACYMLVAIGIAAVPRVGLRAALLAGIAVLVAPSDAARYLDVWPVREFPHRPGVHPPQPFDQAAHYIRDRWKDGDAVVHGAYDPSNFSLSWYGLRGHLQSRGSVSKTYIQNFYAANPVTSRTLPELVAYFPVLIQNLVADKERVWFVYGDWEREYLVPYAVNDWRWMETHFHQVDAGRFGDTEIFLYANRENGQPVDLVKRDRDDGVSALQTYRGGRVGEVRVVKPDRGLIARSLEQRRGRLCLSFDPNPDPSVAGVLLENRGDRPVTCAMESAASSLLVDAASFYQIDPSSEVWSIGDTYNPDRAPENFDLPCAIAHLSKPGSASMFRDVTLPEGTYRTLIRYAGTLDDAAQGRAHLSITADGAELLAPDPGRSKSLVWAWHPGNSVTATSGKPVHLVMTATSDAPRREVWANVGYVAFLPQAQDVAAAPAATGRLMLQPGEQHRWSTPFPSVCNRVDVLCFEQGEDGHGYRIFQERAAQP